MGEQFDPNAGFYYNRARWYSPQIGRFTSVDPYVGDVLSPVSLHRYLYANTSPVTFRDPSGNFTLCEVIVTISTSLILTSMAYYQYGVILSRTKDPVKWEGYLGIVTTDDLSRLGSLRKLLNFSLAATGGGALVDVTTEYEGIRKRALYIVPMFGISVGLPLNMSVGDVVIESPGIFGADPWALTGPFSWGSFTASWGAGKTRTGFIMGLGIAEWAKGYVGGFDIGIDLMGGWSVLVDSY